jgi:hypothetical protein
MKERGVVASRLKLAAALSALVARGGDMNSSRGFEKKVEKVGA